jgi:hypothetical protein
MFESMPAASAIPLPVSPTMDWLLNEQAKDDTDFDAMLGLPPSAKPVIKDAPKEEPKPAAQSEEFAF